MNKFQQFPNTNPKAITRIALCAIVLMFGILGMKLLASLKKPPQQREIKERVMTVHTTLAQAGEYPVVITGFGEVRPLNIVNITPEVMGRVIEVHPRLEQGEVIEPGAMLFRIDATKHVAARDESQARVVMRATTIKRLKTQERLDGERRHALERNERLTHDEFDRLKALFEGDQVGTRSGVDAAERAHNMAQDQAAILRSTVELYPVQIMEAESALQSARAQLARAEYDLARCELRVPFAARVKEVSVELNQLVSSTAPVLTLADDSLLELHVPLDSRDARSLLTFDTSGGATKTAWFQKLETKLCTISWTEARESHTWPGRLHRVVRFDPETRTLTVAIRVNAAEARAGDQGLPLTEGMFCRVQIPGKPLQNVFRVPRSAVSFDNHVFLAVSNRLHTASVEVAYADAAHAYVSSGLHEGDQVIVTRLTKPLEGTLLSLTGASRED